MKEGRSMTDKKKMVAGGREPGAAQKSVQEVKR